MRTLRLYLRSRDTLQSLLRILALAAVTWLLLWLAEESVFVPLLQTIIPVTIAAIIGLSADSPFFELEETTSRPRVVLRLVHLGGLVLLAAVALRVGAWVVPQAGSWQVLVRNTMGYTGLTLLAWRLFGTPNSWVLPLLYASLVFASSGTRLWAWPLHRPDREKALLVALALLFTGMVSVLWPIRASMWFGARTAAARRVLATRTGSQPGR